MKTFQCLALVGLALSAATAVAKADPYDDMASIQRAFTAVHSYRATMDGPRGPIVFEYAAPDRYHVKMTHGEEFVIGNTATVIMHGRRISIPFEQGQEMIHSFQALTADPATLRSQYSVTSLGMDGGQRTYEFFDRKNPTLSTKVWVGANNLPTREVSTDRSGSHAVNYSDYNTPISIVEP